MDSLTVDVGAQVCESGSAVRKGRAVETLPICEQFLEPRTRDPALPIVVEPGKPPSAESFSEIVDDEWVDVHGHGLQIQFTRHRHSPSIVWHPAAERPVHQFGGDVESLACAVETLSPLVEVDDDWIAPQHFLYLTAEPHQH